MVTKTDEVKGPHGRLGEYLKVKQPAQVDHINPQHYQEVLRRSSTFDPGLGKVPESPDLLVARECTPVQVVDIIETFAADDGHIAHALTYLLRRGEKVMEGETQNAATIRDLQKAAWWICRRIEFLGGPENPFVKKA